MTVIYGFFRYWRNSRAQESRGRQESVNEERSENNHASVLTSALSGSVTEGVPNNPVATTHELPHRLHLPPGWPYEPCSDKRSKRILLPLGEFLDESHLLSGRSSPSLVEATSGSTLSSATHSRAASVLPQKGRGGRTRDTRREPAAGSSQSLSSEPTAASLSRHISLDSDWLSERASNVETLPAYTMRRSQSLASFSSTIAQRSQSSRCSRAISHQSSATLSTTRSNALSRARTLSVSRVHALSSSPDLTDFPMELARKLAEAYPRTPCAASPPEYTF